MPKSQNLRTGSFSWKRHTANNYLMGQTEVPEASVLFNKKFFTPPTCFLLFFLIALIVAGGIVSHSFIVEAEQDSAQIAFQYTAQRVAYLFRQTLPFTTSIPLLLSKHMSLSTESHASNVSQAFITSSINLERGKKWITAISWVQRVPHSQRKEFEQLSLSSMKFVMEDAGIPVNLMPQTILDASGKISDNEIDYLPLLFTTRTTKSSAIGMPMMPFSACKQILRDLSNHPPVLARIKETMHMGKIAVYPVSSSKDTYLTAFSPTYKCKNLQSLKCALPTEAERDSSFYGSIIMSVQLDLLVDEILENAEARPYLKHTDMLLALGSNPDLPIIWSTKGSHLQNSTLAETIKKFNLKPSTTQSESSIIQPDFVSENALGFNVPIPGIDGWMFILHMEPEFKQLFYFGTSRSLLFASAFGSAFLVCVVFFYIARQRKCDIESTISRQRADAHLTLLEREALRRFLHCTSHDMRTPLQSAMSALYLLDQSPFILQINVDGLHLLGIVQSSIMFVEMLMNNVLDLDKIENNKLQFLEHPTDLSTDISKLLLMISHLVAADHGQLSLQQNIEQLPLVLCDSPRIQRVVLNLVSNSLKFTRFGHINVTVERSMSWSSKVLSGDEDFVVVRISVTDTGVGMSIDMLEKACKPYVHAPIMEGGGSGLGLFICKCYVENYGGDIEIASKPGNGTRVSFSIKLQYPDSVQEGEYRQRKALEREFMKRYRPVESSQGVPTEPLPMAVEQSSESLNEAQSLKSGSLKSKSSHLANVEGPIHLYKLRILFVEDNQVSRKMGVRMLQNLGHDVESAENGRSALNMIASSKPFDAVLMDINMPVMDGVTAIKQLRRHEKGEHRINSLKQVSNDRPTSKLFACALTGSTSQEDMESYLDAGFDEVLTKPCTALTMQSMLYRHITSGNIIIAHEDTEKKE